MSSLRVARRASVRAGFTWQAAQKAPERSVCKRQELLTELSPAPHLRSAHFSEAVSQRHDGHAHRYRRVQGSYVVLPGPGHRSAQNHADQHQSTQQL